MKTPVEMLNTHKNADGEWYAVRAENDRILWVNAKSPNEAMTALMQGEWIEAFYSLAGGLKSSMEIYKQGKRFLVSHLIDDTDIYLSGEAQMYDALCGTFSLWGKS